MANFISRFFRRLFTLRETDHTFLVNAYSATAPERDRYPYDFQEILSQSLEAWRVNPLARRIVGLTTQYVVGSGLTISCKHLATDDFIHEFWNHPLNHMDVRASEWCDELTRTGNLFILLSTDAGGMSYVRAIPADQIERIDSAANDVEQELSFYPRQSLEDSNPRPWPAYHADHTNPNQVMLHYAINRPVGAQWGEPDLAPLLRWLSRYANWLEDRARLNRFRNAFLFVVKAQFANQTERVARQQLLNSNPPAPGSILVTDPSEEWTVLAPQLQSSEANEDGLALKKMISAGAGVPLHFLAEPESSTRTNAEAAGGPTYRHYEQRQKYFCWLVQDLLTAVVSRHYQTVGQRGVRTVNIKAEIKVQGVDISARDNISLSIATSNIMNAVTQLRDRRIIDDAEMLRMAYRFAMEPVEIEDMIERGRQAGPPLGQPAGSAAPPSPNATPEPPDQDAGGKPRPGEKPGQRKPTSGASLPVNPETGDEKQGSSTV